MHPKFGAKLTTINKMPFDIWLYIFVEYLLLHQVFFPLFPYTPYQIHVKNYIMDTENIWIWNNNKQIDNDILQEKKPKK